MSAYHFEQFKHTVKRSVRCSGCGKKITRQYTFTQTDNPYNKNADGTRKTIPQIRASLADEARAWVPEAKCGRCENPS